VKKPYEKPVTDIEKEFEILTQSKNETKQEILAKKAKEAEKNISQSVNSLMDHILFILESEQSSSLKLKFSLEERKKQTEPLFGIDQLKNLEIIGIPKQFPIPNSINNNIKDLKDLSTHLTSVLCMISALYSYMLSKNIQLEYIAEDRAEIICTLLSNIKLSGNSLLDRKVSSKFFLPESVKNIKVLEGAALVIQRFYRGKKKREIKKQAYIAEYVRVI
jgi:hypothetical protein